MGKYKIVLFLIALSIKSVFTTYYACPPQSVCVPPKNCKSENVTFDSVSNNIKDQEFKYVCGILAQCEDHICCNDPIDLISNFEPNKTHWCYLEETLVESLKIDVQVYPYPGLEEPQSKENLLHIATLCPAGSICVSGSMCPLQFISYSFGFSGDQFQCGSHPGSIGNICCTISGVFEPIMKVPEIKPHFMKKRNVAVTKRESRWSFMDSDYFVDNDVVMSKQELYREVSGKSAKAQEWVCGRTLSIAHELNRIYAPLGDREAKEGDYPWHVAILSSSSYKYLCSGAIIDEKTVVTIAHCFDKHHSAGEILVRVGDLNLQLDTEKNPAFDVRVKHLVIHPNYNKINLDADIAVLELEESVRSLPHVKPVCLPHKSFSPVINQCKVPGWGQFSKSKEEKNEFNYALRAASFYVIDNNQCQNSLRKVKELGAFFKLQKRVLCAKGYSNADTCKGDGGSGLVCRDKDVYVLKGLVSYGFGCGLDLPGVYTDVEKYLEFINNYKRFIPTSSDKVSSINFGSTYSEQNKLYFPEKPISSGSKFSANFDGPYNEQKLYSPDELTSSGQKVSSADFKLYSPEKQKYVSDFEPEDKISSYVTAQKERTDQSPYVTVQREKTDQSQNYLHISSKTNYVDESPFKLSYNDNEFIQISKPYETLEEEEYTYIKPQEPEYVERPQFDSNLYQPDEKVKVYTESSIKDAFKYEENNFDSGYEFSNSRDNEYDANYISRSEYKPEKFQYDNEEKVFENTYKPSYNLGYSDKIDTRDYDSSHAYDQRPGYQFYDPTLTNFGYDDGLSYQPDYARPKEDEIYRPDYTKPKEDKVYQPYYTLPDEDVLSYQLDYKPPNEDTHSYQPDYIRPNEDQLYQPGYKRPNEDTLSYQPGNKRPNEDTLSYQPGYTHPDEDTLSYQPDYKQPNEETFYQPDKRLNGDTLSYHPDYTRSDYATQSDKLHYTEPKLKYHPGNDFEGYSARKENYKGTSRPTNDYTSLDDRLYYEDLDHLRYGRGLKSYSPKNVNVKTHSKIVSGKASGESGNILGVYSSDSSVRKGKVTSPLAMLKRKYWVK